MTDREIEIDGLNFVLTCGACPEQYDVFHSSEQVAYIRLRHGHLSCDMPDCGGEEVFYVDDFPDGDGCFDSHSSRMDWLTEIAGNINRILSACTK